LPKIEGASGSGIQERGSGGWWLAGPGVGVGAGAAWTVEQDSRAKGGGSPGRPGQWWRRRRATRGGGRPGDGGVDWVTSGGDQGDAELGRGGTKARRASGTGSGR
jgi:hypothetical protein